VLWGRTFWKGFVLFLLFGRGGGEVVGEFTNEKADYAGCGV